LTNLGVCMMRMNRLDEAEQHMLEALPHTKSQQERRFVEENLDILESHLAWRRNEPIKGVKYRRRAGPSTTSDFQHTGAGDGSSKSKVDMTSTEYRHPELLHDPHVVRGAPFPRLSMSELEATPGALGSPFILTDGMTKWPLLKSWPAEWRTVFSELFPNAVTDFYPYNMLSETRQHPYLTRLPKAIRELHEPEESYHFKPTPPDAWEGRYMHLQLTPSMWNELERRGDLPKDRHSFLKNDQWIQTCLDDPALADEWNIKTHWKILLVGTRGAGMFNHSDSLLTSSWHAHIMGNKWWYVCGQLPNRSHVCFDEVLQPGDILYYPRRWHHETQILETPTMTLTDTVAHTGNAEGILDKIYGECSGRYPLNFDLSAKLCDAVLGCASKFWQAAARNVGVGWQTPSRSWRADGDPSYVAKREAVLPEHNNYDGRNHITE